MLEVIFRTFHNHVNSNFFDFHEPPFCMTSWDDIPTLNSMHAQSANLKWLRHELDPVFVF